MQRLGVKTPWILSPDQPVLRIKGCAPFVRSGRLLVSAAVEDQAMHGFQ
jgi:hypothetical protein